MRNRLLFLLLATAAVAGCDSEGKFGPCIGAFDDPNPKYVYRTSGWNVAMGAIFCETLVVPAVVLATETKCPQELREVSK